MVRYSFVLFFRFVIEYLIQHPPPFLNCREKAPAEPARKKVRLETQHSNNDVDALQLAKAVHVFLCHARDELRDAWDFSEWYRWLQTHKKETRW